MGVRAKRSIPFHGRPKGGMVSGSIALVSQSTEPNPKASQTATAPCVLLLAALQEELAPTIAALRLDRADTAAGASAGPTRHATEGEKGPEATATDSDAEPSSPPAILAEGQVEGVHLIVRATGMGGTRAAAVASQLIEAYRPVAILAIGVAGGLDPALKPAEVRRAGRVIDEHGQAYTLCPTAPPQQAQASPADAAGSRPDAAGGGEHPATVSERAAGSCGDASGASSQTPAAATMLSVEQIVSSVEQKAELFQRHGAAMVDMESAALAALAARRGLPLTILRAVSDPADHALPAQTAEWVREDGTIDTKAAMMFLATHPWLAGRMMTLRRNAQAAAAALAGPVRDALQTITRGHHGTAPGDSSAVI